MVVINKITSFNLIFFNIGEFLGIFMNCHVNICIINK